MSPGSGKHRVLHSGDDGVGVVRKFPPNRPREREHERSVHRRTKSRSVLSQTATTVIKSDDQAVTALDSPPWTDVQQGFLFRPGGRMRLQYDPPGTVLQP